MTGLGLTTAAPALPLPVGCAGGSWENHEWPLHRKDIPPVGPERVEPLPCERCLVGGTPAGFGASRHFEASRL